MSANLDIPSTVVTLVQSLDRGNAVAVVTMTGTCCPVTLAHIQAFFEARKLLLKTGQYDEVLGGLSLNGDFHVQKKLQEKGLASIPKTDRQHLVELSCQDHPWLNYNSTREYEYVAKLKERFPHLTFVHVRMNGADDVLKYSKWTSPDTQIVMCRPGITQDLLQALKKAKVDVSNGKFIVGPELRDISSTEVRDALVKGEVCRLQEMLHPAVLDWCWHDGPYRPPTHLATALKAAVTTPSAGAVEEKEDKMRKEDEDEKKESMEKPTQESMEKPTHQSTSMIGAMMVVWRKDDSNGTMLRKIPTHERGAEVFVSNTAVVHNNSIVTVVRDEDSFYWIRAGQGEGYIKKEYLRPHFVVPPTVPLENSRNGWRRCFTRCFSCRGSED